MTQRNGDGAMSVDRCAVTAISSAAGMAASAIQVAALRQVGRALASAVTAAASMTVVERQESTPHVPISAISTQNAIDQA